MSFNAIRENKIIAKMSEFTVLRFWTWSGSKLFDTVMINIPENVILKKNQHMTLKHVNITQHVKN